MTDENLTLDDIEQDLINQVYSLDADDPKTTIAIENLKTIHQINEKPDSVSRRLIPSGDSIVGAVCSIRQASSPCLIMSNCVRLRLRLSDSSPRSASRPKLKDS